MKKTFKTRVGDTFIAGGLGSQGPYGLAYKKVNRATAVKVSCGTRGVELQVDRKIGRRTRASAGISSVSGPYAEMKYKERKLRISAADVGWSHNKRRKTLAERLLRSY